MLIPSLPIGSSEPQTSESGSCLAQLVLAVSQSPVKSGLPSGVRGAGADRFGLPSAVFGTLAVGYFSHCAERAADQPRQEAAARANDIRIDRRVMDVRMALSPEISRHCTRTTSRPRGRGPGCLTSGMAGGWSISLPVDHGAHRGHRVGSRAFPSVIPVISLVNLETET